MFYQITSCVCERQEQKSLLSPDMAKYERVLLPISDPTSRSRPIFFFLPSAGLTIHM